MDIRPRESVILADDYDALVAWYQTALGFELEKSFDGGFKYANLRSTGGVRIGVAPACEVGVEPRDRSRASVLLQVEVDDVRELLGALPALGGKVTLGPAHDEDGGFWFGGFADPEGNGWWVVDKDCP